MKYDVRRNQMNFYKLLKDNITDGDDDNCFNFYQFNNDEKNILKLSRKELLNRSLKVAEILEENGAEKGDRLIIFSTQSYDNVISMVASMFAGTIFTIIPPPVDINKITRFKSVIDSCNPKFILCSGKLKETIECVLMDEKFGNINLREEIKIINVEECNGDTDFIPEPLALDDVVDIQYSSGSTSEPKGVMVTYGNIISAVNSSPKVLEIKRIFGWVPFFHNLGLLYLVLIPLTTKGVKVGIMSQLDFLQRPARWIEGLSEFKAEGTLAPNSVYEIYPKLVPASKLSNIDLSNLKFILSGSEIVTRQAMERFAAEYEQFGININNFAIGYGLSETTCGITATTSYSNDDVLNIDFDKYKNGEFKEVEDNNKDKIEFISNGKPFGRNIVKIVNDETFEECAENEFGEVWIQSPCVAKGYYKNEKATQETFYGRLANGEGNFLRTGDKGVIKDGNLFITGRLKELIIVNGNNILPNDIVCKIKEEVTDLSNDIIFPFSVMNDNKEKLVMVIGVTHPISPKVVNDINLCLLKNFEITPFDIKFIKATSIPRTDSGKASVSLVKKAYINKSLEYLNGNVAEKKTIKYNNNIEEFLGGIAKSEFKFLAGPQDNLLNLGMDSLEVVQLTAEIQNKFNVSIPVAYIFDNPSIEKIAEYISRSLNGEDLSSLERDKSFLYNEVKLDENIKFNEYEDFNPAMKKVFVTGTTGFLGAYLLKNLFDTTDAEIYCHVRAKNETAGFERIKKNMEFYKLWDDQYESRIKPVTGSLNEERLGIAEDEYNYLAENIDTIIHNGAILNFIYPYSTLKQTNVLGTIETLKLASQGKAKYYNYISSYSVFDNPSHFNKTVFEDDPLLSCMGYYLSYSESKWVAENIIHLARQRGLRAAIYRPGEITGAIDTAIWKLSDSVSRTIKAIMETGEYPKMDMNIHMTQIDYIAAAIIKICQNGWNYGKAFNLLNSKPVSIKRLGEIINDSGYETHEVDYDIYKADLFNAGNEHPLKLLEALFKINKKEPSENIDLRYGQVSAHLDMSNTENALAGSGIECKPMDETIIKKYIKNFS